MKLLLIRDIKTDLSTIGKLFIDGEHRFFTLELPWKENKSGISCIPTGTYNIELAFSERFHMKVPLLQDVPGREAIEIHVGNFPKDTHGCILVGLGRDSATPNWIGESTKAFGILLLRIALAKVKNEPITIEVKEEA